MPDPIPLHNRMSDLDYERERARLRDLYGDNSKEAGAKRDQALAILFYRSGWTQEELAKKEGKSQSFINYRLRFGRFLNFITDVINPENTPNNLTEGKFRAYWEHTDKKEMNERIRFVAVQRLMREDLNLKAQRRPLIGKDIIAAFGDGKWYDIPTIAKELNLDEDHVAGSLHSMKAHGSYGANCEMRAKKIDRPLQYRIFPADRVINVSEIKAKLLPILKGLKVEGRKNDVTMSPPTVAMFAALLERQITEWVEGTVSSYGRPDEIAARSLDPKDENL